MARVVIGIGANIAPEANIRRALTLLGERVQLVALSTFYRTPALEREGQPPFLNGVVAVETAIAPAALKQEVLRGIEEALGRQRTADKYAPRPIDLDIAVYDQQVIATADLTIPDPEITRRPFLAIPLCELAPDLVLPDSGRRVCEVAAALDASAMEPLPEFTRELREQLLPAPANQPTE